MPRKHTTADHKAACEAGHPDLLVWGHETAQRLKKVAAEILTAQRLYEQDLHAMRCDGGRQPRSLPRHHQRLHAAQTSLISALQDAHGVNTPEYHAARQAYNLTDFVDNPR